MRKVGRIQLVPADVDEEAVHVRRKGYNDGAWRNRISGSDR